MRKIISTMAVLTAAVLFFAGCGDYVGKEKTHPLFVKGASCRTAGNYVDAAKYFDEFLNVCPRSPLAHYEAAVVYGDNLDNPFKAVYHYERYLELTGNDSPDSANVRKFIDTARRKAFEKLSATYESKEAAAAYAQAEKTKKFLDRYVVYSKALKQQNDALRDQNQSMRKMIADFGKKQQEPAPTEKTVKEPESGNLLTSPETDKSNSGDAWEKAKAVTGTPSVAKVDGAKTKVKPESAGKTPSEEKKEPSADSPKKDSAPVPGATEYTVKPGDTLMRISREVYGHNRYYKLILKANEEKLGAKGILRIGQKLTIPPLPAASGGPKP